MSDSLPTWFADALDSLAAGDVDGWVALYTDDAVHEFPFAPEGQPRRLEGRDAIAAYMSQLPDRIRFGEITDVRVHEAGDELIVEATGHHTRLPDETPLHLGYVWIITADDGRVSRVRDYMGPAAPAASRPTA